MLSVKASPGTEHSPSDPDVDEHNRISDAPQEGTGSVGGQTIPEEPEGNHLREPKSSDIVGIRRKRGSLDPLIGYTPRLVLNMKRIPNYVTTAAADIGFRTTIWPLKRRGLVKRNVKLKCFLKAFIWPLLCLCCLLSCCLALFFARCYRKANCFDNSLGFPRTYCLMCCCCCCPRWMGKKLFSSHFGGEKDYEKGIEILTKCPPPRVLNTAKPSSGFNSLNCSPNQHVLRLSQLQSSPTRTVRFSSPQVPRPSTDFDSFGSSYHSQGENSSCYNGYSSNHYDMNPRSSHSI